MVYHVLEIFDSDNIFLHSEVATFHWSKVSRKVGIVESILSAVSLC